MREKIWLTVYPVLEWSAFAWLSADLGHFFAAVTQRIFFTHILLHTYKHIFNLKNSFLRQDKTFQIEASLESWVKSVGLGGLCRQVLWLLTMHSEVLQLITLFCVSDRVCATLRSSNFNGFFIKTIIYVVKLPVPYLHRKVKHKEYTT